MYILHLHYLVGVTGLGQTVEDCALICIYDQLFKLHCKADWLQHCQQFKGSSQILLLELGVVGKIQKLLSYMILPSEAHPCYLVLHEVRVKTTGMT